MFISRIRHFFVEVRENLRKFFSKEARKVPQAKMYGIRRIYSLLRICQKSVRVIPAPKKYKWFSGRRTDRFYILLVFALSNLALSRVASAQQVATPTFNPNGGNFLLEKSVTVSCSTEGATIHYTTNGVTPTENDRTVASGGTVLVDRPLTLEANASKIGMTTSATATAAFNISGKLAAGQTHSVALKSDGTVWAWGGNASGQLGIGATYSSTHAAPVQSKLNSTTFLSGMSIVAAGASHSLAVQTSDGSVFGWGLNSSGQLGD